MNLGHVFRGWKRSDLTPARLAQWDHRNDRYEEGSLETQLDLAFELRRCHAHRVFAAIQAVVAVTVAVRAWTVWQNEALEASGRRWTQL